MEHFALITSRNQLSSDQLTPLSSLPTHSRNPTLTCRTAGIRDLTAEGAPLGESDVKLPAGPTRGIQGAEDLARRARESSGGGGGWAAGRSPAGVFWLTRHSSTLPLRQHFCGGSRPRRLAGRRASLLWGGQLRGAGLDVTAAEPDGLRGWPADWAGLRSRGRS